MLHIKLPHELRPEAQKFEYERLNASQRMACRNILIKLDQALNQITRSSAFEDDTRYKKPWVYPVPENNPNKVILLTGGRGSGKTSVLFSLIHILNEEKQIGNIDGESTSAENGVVNLITKEKSRNFIWLNPIEMETLPASTNLLTAILSRIDKAVSRFRGKHPEKYQEKYAFAFHPDEQDVLLEFSKLQQDVALAWNGNLSQRAANIDTDVFAIEVLRAEHSRINLNERMETCINRLHDHFIKPGQGRESLFVLPVDDFDINPDRCIELIRLIRMLNIPRLVTLILGDIRVISHVMNLKFIEAIVTEKSSGKPGFPFESIDYYDECRLSHELAANALRKLFAPSNRIVLRPMKPDEVFAFHYKDDDKNGNTDQDKEQSPKPDKTIQYYLKNYKNIVLNTAHYKKTNDENKTEELVPVIAGKEIINLFALFNIKVEELIGTDLKQDLGITGPNKDQVRTNRYVYVARYLFRISPRHAQDMWRDLRNDPRLKCENKGQDEKGESGNGESVAQEHKTRDAVAGYIRFAERLFKDRVAEGRNLTFSAGAFLNDILYRDFTGMPQLDTSSLRFVYTYGQPILIHQAKTMIGVHHPKSWSIKLRRDLMGGALDLRPSDITLHDTTSSALVFLHDMLAFSNPNQITGKKLVHHEKPPIWAYTQWPCSRHDLSVKVAWPHPPWQTMFECDILRRCWVEVWKWVCELKKSSQKNDEFNVALEKYLPYAWMTIITNIIDDHEEKLLQLPNEETLLQFPEKSNDIDILIGKINKLPKTIDKHYERRERLIDGWTAAIACLLAPETDFHPKIVQSFASNSDFKKTMINKPSVPELVRKWRTQSAVLFFDNGVLDLLFELFCPNSKTTWNPDVASGKNETRTDFINLVGGGALCPFVEDIVHLSSLPKMTKRKYERYLLDKINNPMESYSG